MVFQPISCTAACVATGTGELLPHLFTLIPSSRDGYFLLHRYTLADIFPLGRMVLFAVRTFLPEYSGRWNGQLPSKVTKTGENGEILVIFDCLKWKSAV